MSDASARRHALEAFLARRGDRAGPDAQVRVTLRPLLDLFILRGASHDPALVDAAGTALGQPLPVAANTVSRGEHAIYWLGPDEWLIVTRPGNELSTPLLAALNDRHVAVTPQHGGLVVLSVAGPAARQVLAAGCTLDLHPRALAVNECAQTGLAKASVLISLDDDAPVFTLIVRRSFADYVARWLAHAGSAAGLSFAVQDNEGTI